MELVARFCWCAMLQMLNWSIYLGMALAALLALRPMTRRFLEPRQRVALWGVVWLSFCLPQWINLLDWVPLPFTLRSFLTPRTYCDSGFDHFPMYLPEITGEGTYHLALPGGFSIPIQVSWQGMVLLVLLGAAYFVVIFSLARWSDRGVRKLASQGRALETEDYERLGLTMAEGQSIKLCPDLPTSFVLRRKGGHDILLQRELTGEQMKLVLIHEREHVKQRHPWLQGIASAVWILNFWNPLVWLAYRAFRLDMELACDQGVLEQLDLEGRRSYARTLVELASDRPVWGGVTSFGECDAALRVRAGCQLAARLQKLRAGGVTERGQENGPGLGSGRRPGCLSSGRGPLPCPGCRCPGCDGAVPDLVHDGGGGGLGRGYNFLRGGGWEQLYLGPVSGSEWYLVPRPVPAVVLGGYYRLPLHT